MAEPQKKAAPSAKPKQMGTGHHPSALKRDRQNEKHRVHNRTFLAQMRNQIKRLRASLASKNKSEAQSLLKTTIPFIAKMAGKGMIHRNTAARHASRLVKQYNAIP